METEMDSVHREIAWTNTAQNRAHTFCFVKYQKYTNPLIKSKIEDATLEIQSEWKEIQDLNKELKEIADNQKYRLMEAGFCKSNVQHAKYDLELIRKFMDEKLMMRFHSPDEEQLYGHMSVLKHDLRNKKLSSNETKRVMKEMKELQVEIEKAKADDLSNLKEEQRILKYTIEGINRRRPKKLSLKKCFEVQKDYHQVELVELKGWRECIKSWDRDIKFIQDEINVTFSKVARLNTMLLKYKKMEDDENACYYRNVKILNRAKHLAVEKDIAALEKLSNKEMERFFAQWKENKAFKKDYEKRVLASLESRGLNKDGTSATIEEISVPHLSDSTEEIITSSVSDSTKESVDPLVSDSIEESLAPPACESKKIDDFKESTN